MGVKYPTDGSPVDPKNSMAEDQQTTNPSKLPRLSSDHAPGEVTMAAPPPPQLMLGLGLGSGDGKAAFTFMQMQELQHQALIYKYLTAGVPVPLHLVLPIWKSVAGSSAGPHRYPTLMGWGSLCLDYRNSMEPEPGRCRRTDGKKWRCSRDVVPDHKYCDRHIHRGRNRSRKPVEAAAVTPISVRGATGISSSSNLAIAVRKPGSGGSSGNSNNVSPTRMGFSPSSVLGGGGDRSKNGAS